MYISSTCICHSQPVRSANERQKIKGLSSNLLSSGLRCSFSSTFICFSYSLLGGGGEGGGTPIYNLRGCSSKFSKETPKSYHIGCGSSQLYSLKVTSELLIHRNNTGILKIIAKGQQFHL